MTEAVLEATDDHANVLLLGRTMDETVSHVHRDLLTDRSPETTRVLTVTFQSPRRLLRTWQQEIGTDPVELGIVAVSETLSGRPDEMIPDESTENVSVQAVSPTDLTGLGIVLSDFLGSWSGETEAVVACFDSLTDLLQYSDTQTVFRFLRIATRRLELVDASAHFHLDPSAHGEQTVATLQSAFDAVVTVEDGEVETRRRF
jgi:hypothetical protein